MDVASCLPAICCHVTPPFIIRPTACIDGYTNRGTQSLVRTQLRQVRDEEHEKYDGKGNDDKDVMKRKMMIMIMMMLKTQMKKKRK
jgi:hypothetical protein